MKILRTKTFSLKDKFKEFNQKLDDKLMKAIVKDEKTLDDTIHQYKGMLKDENLSEKDKKQLKGLLVTAKRVKKTFSEKEKEDSKKQRNKRVAAIAGLAAGGTASAVLGTKVIPRKLEERAAEEVSGAINKKLQNVGLQGGNFNFMDYMANREKHRAEMEEVGEKIGKKLKRNKTISKAAGIAGAGLAAGGLGYIAYKHYKNKKKDGDKEK